MPTTDRLTDTIKQLRFHTHCLHAADESGGNIAKKFQQLGVADTPENRIAYRGAMITTPGYGDVIGGVILKTNMVLAGVGAPTAAEADSVRDTISTLTAAVPSTTGAVVFLSGGQTTPDAMRRLEEMRKAATRAQLPYAVSSSFSRALQGPALETFGAAVRGGASPADIKRRTQASFAETLKLNATALKKSA